MSATSHSPSAASGAGYQLLGDLPRGHPLRRQPLGPMGAECRNMHSKEWRDVARWRIASCAFDDLGEVLDGDERVSSSAQPEYRSAASARRRALKMQRGRRDPEGPFTRTLQAPRMDDLGIGTRSECAIAALRAQGVRRATYSLVRSSAKHSFAFVLEPAGGWRGPWSVHLALERVRGVGQRLWKTQSRAEGQQPDLKRRHRSIAAELARRRASTRRSSRSGFGVDIASAERQVQQLRLPVDLSERDSSGERATDPGCPFGDAPWRRGVAVHQAPRSRGDPGLAGTAGDQERHRRAGARGFRALPGRVAVGRYREPVPSVRLHGHEGCACRLGSSSGRWQVPRRRPRGRCDAATSLPERA
jgi:hypothetical protein